MASNAELQAEVERLEAEADDLAAERDRLAEELEQAKANAVVLPNTHPQPTEPSFGLTEGNRAELEQRGHTVSPFTGARLVADVSNGQVSNVREVDQETYDRVAKKAAVEAERPKASGTTFPKANSQ